MGITVVIELFKPFRWLLMLGLFSTPLIADPTASVINPVECRQQVVGAVRATTLTSWQFPSVTAETFYRAFSQRLTGPTKNRSLDEFLALSEEQPPARFFLVKSESGALEFDGGFAITGDRQVISIFKHQFTNVKGLGRAIAHYAVSQGARYLWCYRIEHLLEIYRSANFEIAEEIPYEAYRDSIKPENIPAGNPDRIRMVVKPEFHVDPLPH